MRFHVWQNSKWLKAIHEARIPEGLHLYYADFRFRRFCLERLIGLDIFATNRLFQTDSVHSLSYPVGHDKDALRAFDRCWLLDLVDTQVLQKQLGIPEQSCMMARNIWKKLRKRRTKKENMR